MSAAEKLKTLDDLLAYALAIEADAAERYVELSDMMAVHNNRELADFFKRMSEVEQMHVDHVKHLSKPSASASTPAPIDLGGREAPDWDEFHYLHRPYHAISIALRFEQRAADFFAELSRTAEAPDVRQMAAELAEDEVGHIRELHELLQRHPAPPEDWDYDPDPVGEQ